MASEIRVNKINSRTGFGTITVSETGQDLVGITTIENLTTENTLVGAAASFTGNVQVGGVLTYEDVTNIDSVGLITARQGIEVGARPGVAASISVDGNMIVSGISTFDGDVKLSDNKKIVFGAGSDLEIYHDGSSSAILNNNNQQLTISSDNALNLTSRTGQEYFFRGYTGGAAELYYDNSKKFETKSYGALVTGYITASPTSGNLGFHAGDDTKMTFGTSDDLQLYHSGDWNYIQSYNSKNLAIQVKDNENAVIAIPDGEVQLYHNNELQALTAANGLRIKTAGDTNTELSVVGPEGRSGIINLEADDGDDNADIWRMIASTDGKFYLQNYTSGSYENTFRATGNGATELYYDNNLRAFTTDTGFKIKTTDTDVAKIEFQTGNHDYSLVGYTGLNRFGIDTHDGLEIRDASDSYATRFKIDATGICNVIGKGSGFSLQTNHHCIQNNNATSWAMQTVNTASLGYGLEIRVNSATASREGLYLYSTSDTEGKAAILTNGTFSSRTNTYGSLSDVKLKENIVDANSQWDDLKAIKVRNFNFISDSSNTKLLGVVAQELETVCPNLVEEVTDKEIDENGDRVETGTTTKSVKYSVLYMKAIKTLQEAQTRIETLETRLNNAGIAT